MSYHTINGVDARDSVIVTISNVALIGLRYAPWARGASASVR